MHRGKFHPLTSLANYTYLLNKLGVFSNEEKDEILEKIKHVSIKKTRISLK